MTAWRLQGDMVVLEGLRLRLHRIGRSHWRASGSLRSWGAVPLHRVGNALHAPCAPDEALWLGAWLDDDDAAGDLRLSETASGRAAGIVLPDAFQLTALAGANGTPHPIELAAPDLSMTLACGPAHADIALTLHAPGDWAALSGRPAPRALAGPPPLPPRLG
ncbi:hypothetical protein [Variovorax paradoxus]|jgi:hypothetical protein|uniref:Uncharacterized protein n=1 Tax=Variovorax paradoxus TaxID=34073 RepID=A0A679JG57_VARPD|nr:hypothetical protein VVAX_03205 [Variovorax paradoxus]